MYKTNFFLSLLFLNIQYAYTPLFHDAHMFSEFSLITSFVMTTSVHQFAMEATKIILRNKKKKCLNSEEYN